MARTETEANTFGVVEEGGVYKTREGVYALIQGANNTIVLVGRVDSDLHELPGGGIEEGESHEAGLARELREELGWSIKIGEYLGKGIQYTMLSPRGRHYKLEGHFYAAEKLKEIGGKVELDHVERSLSFSDARLKVKYEYQKWAISQFEKFLND